MAELGANARRRVWLLDVVQADSTAVPLKWLVEKKTIHRSWRLYRRWGFDVVVHGQVMAAGCCPGRHRRECKRFDDVAVGKDLKRANGNIWTS